MYFLTGVDPETDQPTLYIGEAESVVKRLKQHRERDDWSQVIVFVSKDENLTKAHIRYLEGVLINLANEAKNASVQNNASSGVKLPESDKAEMDVFLEKVLQLLPILGIDLFKIVECEESTSDDLLFLTTKGVSATEKRIANGFVVFKGSQAVKDHRPSTIRWAEKREQYISDGLLRLEGDHYVFTEDFKCGSPSTAGAIICGGSTNGLLSWKNSKGIALKELEKNG